MLPIRYLLVVFSLLIAPFGISAQSFTPSQEQIEMFKRLSPEQQQSLAKRYNLDLGSLGLSTQATDSTIVDDPLLMLPRDGQNEEEVAEDELTKDKKFKKVKEEEEPKPFGYDIFAAQPSTFSPLSKAPVPLNYIIGAGDQLMLTLYGKENQQYTLEVTREGFLEIPNMEPLAVVGMSYRELKDFVSAKVEQQFVGVKTSLSFGQLRSIQVFIVGEAFTPGSYTVSSLSTITQALFVSGGIKEKGSLRNIQLKRAGKTIVTLDLYDFIIRGDASNDLRLESGDVVLIPALNQSITVRGAVNRPAIYEVRSEETFADLLDMAGGAKTSASVSNATIHQFNNGVKTIVNRDLTNKQELAASLAGTSELVVPEVNDRFDNAIQVVGAVSTPGFYQWRQGLTVSTLIGNEITFLKESTDTSYSLILRESKSGIAIKQINISKLLRGLTEDIPLASGDKLFFFSKYNQSNQLLEFEEITQKESARELIREKVEKDIEERFFWDLYKNITDPDGLIKGQDSDTPTIYELENERLASLIEKFNIYQWDKTTRQYLLWPIYRHILNKTSYEQRLPLIEISGNVRFPGTYPKADLLTLRQALEASGGLTDLAAEVVKVSRIADAGKVEQFDVLISDADTFELKPKDSITVFPRPEINEAVTVQIVGEVLYPGAYTFKRGSNLSELVAQAGGMTPHAYADGAIFTRLDLKTKERKNLLDLSDELRKQLAAKKLTQSVTDTGTASYSELQRVLSDLTSVEAVGRMVIDLPAILAGNSQADIQMIRGDILYIPPKSETVSVIGEVYLPTSHRYSNSMNIEDYIQSSGGIKRLGDSENVYVIKANGSVIRPENSGFWFAANQQQLSEGDTIVVPMDTAPIDNLTLWSAVTQILYQTGVAVAAIGSL